ncbi:MAG: hypothetical protein JWM11_2475 [Planctomycetaceae bacterium]|nr:hypothetical protein [Planctomycetaceae bacterium]
MTSEGVAKSLKAVSNAAPRPGTRIRCNFLCIVMLEDVQAGRQVAIEEYTMSGPGINPEFDPYHKWLGIAPSEQPPNHYRLLGISKFENDVTVIEAAADRALTFLRKHQMGQNHQQANQLLNEVTRAWRCLAKPESRAKYDATLTDDSEFAPIEFAEAAPDPSHSSLRRKRSNRKRRDKRLAIWVGGGVAAAFAIIALLMFLLRSPEPGPKSKTDAESVASTQNDYPPTKVESKRAEPESRATQRADVSIPKTVLPPAANAPKVAVDYHPPEHVSVLPLAFIPRDQQPPTNDEQALFLKHLNLTQQRYRELLNGDTFEIAKQQVQQVSGGKSLDFYRTAPEQGASDIVSELLEHFKTNRFQCPYVFCILLMNSKDDFPSGGGRPINGGVNTGGGMMYLSSRSLVTNEHFQCTLQHELGHGFGLPHVDAYGYDMATNPSLMSYNAAHFTKGFAASPTPGILIPEDRRALALNRRVFAKATFDSARDMPAVYPLAKRILTLPPMDLPGQPAYYATLTSNVSAAPGINVDPIVREQTFPSARWVNFDFNLMWHSLRNLPNNEGEIQITFPFEVRLSGISIHSQHMALDHEATGVRLQIMDGDRRRVVVERPLTKIDELVSFPPATGQKWSLLLKGNKSQTLIVRGLRFFDGGQEVFPHQVPYRNEAGVDDVAPSAQSANGKSVARNTVIPLPADVAKTGLTESTPGPKSIVGALGSEQMSPVPDPAAQSKAKKSLQEKFRAQYSQAKKLEGKVALAIALMSRASDTEVDNAERYVALSDALDEAAESGNLTLAQEALQALTTGFQVSPQALKQKLISAAAGAIKSIQEAQLLYVQSLELAHEAARDLDYGTSIKVMQSVSSALKKPEFKEVQDFAKFEIKRYMAYRELFDSTKTARDKLGTNPMDPKANLAWGRFVCFYQGDWDQGLPMLIQSGDKTWKSIAERELSIPSAPQDQLKLGTDWLNAGEKEKDPIRLQCRQRGDAVLKTAASQVMGKKENAKLAELIDQQFSRLFDKTIQVSQGVAGGAPIADTESLNPGEEFTIEFWFLTMAREGVLISKRHNGSEGSIQVRTSFREDGTTQQLHFEAFGPPGVIGGGTGANYPISDGHWHHLAIVKQGIRLTLFVDGKLMVSTDIEDSRRLNAASPWKFGCSEFGPPLAGTFARPRFSNNARYTKEFTPQKQFVKDIWTLSPM